MRLVCHLCSLVERLWLMDHQKLIQRMESAQKSTSILGRGWIAGPVQPIHTFFTL